MNGKKFKFWAVLTFSHRDSGRNDYWICKCKCGNKKTVSGNSLRLGKSKSCGCYTKTKEFIELQQKNAIIHGNFYLPEYRTWKSMHHRCYNEKSTSYGRYGKKGIKICKRWHIKNPNGFNNFLNDMGKKPNSIYTIDRIKNNKGYSPKNCGWVTPKENNNNRDCVKISEFDGLHLNNTEWSYIFNICPETVRTWLLKNKTIEDLANKYDKERKKIKQFKNLLKI